MPPPPFPWWWLPLKEQLLFPNLIGHLEIIAVLYFSDRWRGKKNHPSVGDDIFFHLPNLQKEEITEIILKKYFFYL